MLSYFIYILYTAAPCKSNPCQNGGICNVILSNQPQFNCTCPEEFTGSKCQTGQILNSRYFNAINLLRFKNFKQNLAKLQSDISNKKCIKISQ